MGKADIIKKIALKHQLPEKIVNEMINSTFDLVKIAMKDPLNHKKITINKLGNFIPKMEVISPCCNAQSYYVKGQLKLRPVDRKLLCPICKAEWKKPKVSYASK